MPDRQNKAFFWAAVFLRELHAYGVKHLVISPGSRSTPLVLAGAAHGGFSSHVVLDERSAGYIALGIGRATGSPAALICTSGTAAANYFPAVIEAREAGVPLIVMTADRPPLLRNNGASQAIDQIKIFGDYPVFFHEAGEPVMEQADLERLRQSAGQAYHFSRSRMGPTHINFPFRKPLEPDPDFLQQVRSENDDAETESPPATLPSALTGPCGIPDRVREWIEQSEHPVVISSTHIPGQTETVESLARLMGAPLLAEFNTGKSRYRINGFSGFLKDPDLREELSPDLIIRFGRQPTGKALQSFLEEQDDCKHLHFGDLAEWHDPGSRVTHRVDWLGRKIDWGHSPGNPGKRSQWLEKWKRAEERFIEFRNREIEKVETLTDGHIFYHMSKVWPASWNLFLSNSFPVRDWMLFGDAPVSPPTFLNRGTSGIDGILSSAIGTTIGSGKPGILFIGDLAMLHDSNALLSAGLSKQPLVVVLINNRGGNIFRMLPVYRHPEFYTHFFETPQTATFEELARTYGTGYHKIDSLEMLIKIDPKKLFSEPGIHLVECVTDPDRSMKMRNRLWGQRYGED